MSNSFHRVKTIAKKEVIEFVRDWRTIVAIIIIPILMFPVLFIVFPILLESEAAELDSRIIEIEVQGEQFPEQLITIYGPKSYPVLLQYLAQSYYCPRKMLINSEVEIVEVNDNLIRNINTPEEYTEAKKELN